MDEFTCDVRECPALGCIQPACSSGGLLLCGHHFRKLQVPLAMAGFSEVHVVDTDYAREVASALLQAHQEARPVDATTSERVES